MTATEANALCMRLRSAFPQSQFPPETIGIYIEFVSKLDLEPATRAVDDLIRTGGQWMPSIGHVVQAARESGPDALPSAEEALAEAKDALRRGLKSPDMSHPLVGFVLERLGREKYEERFDERMFLQVYAKLREKCARGHLRLPSPFAAATTGQRLAGAKRIGDLLRRPPDAP